MIEEGLSALAPVPRWRDAWRLSPGVDRFHVAWGLAEKFPARAERPGVHGDALPVPQPELGDATGTPSLAVADAGGGEIPEIGERPRRARVAAQRDLRSFADEDRLRQHVLQAVQGRVIVRLGRAFAYDARLIPERQRRALERGGVHVQPSRA